LHFRNCFLTPWPKQLKGRVLKKNIKTILLIFRSVACSIKPCIKQKRISVTSFERKKINNNICPDRKLLFKSWNKLYRLFCHDFKICACITQSKALDNSPKHSCDDLMYSNVKQGYLQLKVETLFSWRSRWVYNINWRDVQIKNFVNNVDLSS